MLAIDEVIRGVLEVPIGPHSPIRHLDPHQYVFPVDPRVHPPPQLDPPQFLSTADL